MIRNLTLFYVFLKDLESRAQQHKPQVEETLTQGKELVGKSDSSPDVLNDNLLLLETLWKRVLELLLDKRKDLEELLEQWTQYRIELEEIMTKLTEKEAEYTQKVEAFGNDEEKVEEQIEEYKVCKKAVIFVNSKNKKYAVRF